MRAILPVALAAAFSLSPAAAEVRGCGLDVDAQVRLDGDALVFAATPSRPDVRLAGDRLWLGGEPVALDAEDRSRVDAISREFAALSPELQALAIDAVDIAFVALDEVATAFQVEDDARARMHGERQRLVAAIDANPAWLLDDGKADDLIEPVVERLVGEFVPTITGAAMTQAMRMALSGDEAGAKAFEARMDAMGQGLETRVEARAKALEPRALAVCGRLERIDALENALDVRTSAGRPLDLIRVRREGDRTAANGSAPAR